MLEWKENLSSNEWDRLLGENNGHPLQSALWGDAKNKAFHTKDYRWALYNNDELLGMVRFESRAKGKVAWLPQVTFNPIFLEYLKEKFRNEKYFVCVTTPYQESHERKKEKRKTVWIDLSVGREVLWSALDKQWRYGARRAQKLGVVVSQTKCLEDIANFYLLCKSLSLSKDFKLNNTSEIFFNYLLNTSSTDHVSAQLFSAKLDGEFCAGALVLASGKHLHYLWGGVNRKYSKERVGEYIQWAVIEWACENSFLRYDLEGIDEVNNPGVASFKKKMGGKVIHLVSPNTLSLNWQGRLAKLLLRKLLA